MASCILNFNVDSTREEALENFLRSTCRSLVNSVVTMHIDVKRTHVLLKEDPNYLVVAFVAGPRKRGVLSNFLSIFRFNERIVFFFSNNDTGSSLLHASFFSTISRTLVDCCVQVGSASVVLDKNPDNLLVTVIRCPEKRVPAVFLNGGRGML